MKDLVLRLNNTFTAHKQKLLLFVKIIITVLLLLYIYSALDYNSIILALRNVNYFPLVIAAILLIPNLYFQFLKWKIVCNVSLAENDNKSIINSLFYGFSGAIITPLRIGEFAGRILGLNGKDPIKITAASFLDKLFTFFQVLFIGIISIGLYLVNYFNTPSYLIISAIVFLLTSVIAGFVLLKSYYKKNYYIVKQKKMIAKIITFLETILTYNKSTILLLSFVSFLFYLCYLIQFALLVNSFSNGNSFYIYFWAGGLVFFAKAVFPLSFGELGIREGASIYFLTQMGTEASAAFNASIFLFILNVLIPSLIGLLLIIRRK